MNGEPRRVLLIGDHPWSGHSGEMVATEHLADVSPRAVALRVELDNGIEVYAFDGQWREVRP